MFAEVERWGKADYRLVLERQLQLVNNCDEKILICSHPPIVTLGRQSVANDITFWSGDILAIQRGGKATYHGPGQVVCYPIIDLKKRAHDIGKYLRMLEKSMIKTLSSYGVNAVGNENKATGVWVEGRKIASIGVAVKRWFTYHGLALNLYRDELAFQGINPCGFSADTMISLEEILQKKVERLEFENVLLENLGYFLRPES